MALASSIADRDRNGERGACDTVPARTIDRAMVRTTPGADREHCSNGPSLPCAQGHCSRSPVRSRIVLVKGVLACISVHLALAVGAQSLETRAVVSGGGHGDPGGVSLSWSIGQPCSNTYVAAAQAITCGVQQPVRFTLTLAVTALLGGPYDDATDLMHDSLRVLHDVPLVEPYSAAGLAPVGPQEGSALRPMALDVSGNDALVDWVYIELRDPVDPGVIMAARPAMLQRDGDVVDVDGVSPVRIAANPGDYRIALRHRNHLPVMTLDVVHVAREGTTLDLTDGSVALHAPNGQWMRDGRALLWPGDVTGSGEVKYTGTGNDRDPVLIAIGGTVPTATIGGYLPADVNLDGTVKYTGVRNDRDAILITIGGTVPTQVRAQPLP